MKQLLYIVGILMITYINILAKPIVTDWVDTPDYPGLKVKHIYASHDMDLLELKEQLPYYNKIIEGKKMFENPEISFNPSDPRPSRYNLIKSENLDFLYEGAVDSAGSIMHGTVVEFNPYDYFDDYIIKEFYIPQEYISEFFIDLSQRGGWDEGIGFMMAILDDTELIYYSDSHKLHEYWSNHLNFNSTRVIFKLKKPMKVSIVSYRTNGDGYFDGFSIRKIPRDIKYTMTLKKTDDKELGDNTLPTILYDLEVDNPYAKGTLVSYYPFYTDFYFPCLVNDKLIIPNQLKDLSSYFIEGGKAYVNIEARHFKGDKLTGSRGELLGYGASPLTWKLELPLKQGVPILQQLIDLVNAMGYSKQERIIILSDNNRRWDYNEQNIRLVNELKKILTQNNIHLYLIGEYEENLFGPLLEK